MLLFFVSLPLFGVFVYYHVNVYVYIDVGVVVLDGVDGVDGVVIVGAMGVVDINGVGVILLSCTIGVSVFDCCVAVCVRIAVDIADVVCLDICVVSVSSCWRCGYCSCRMLLLLVL